MGYEDRILDNIDRERRMNPDRSSIIEPAYERAELAFKKHSIDPTRFTEIYDYEEIQSDLDWVERIKAKFEDNETRKTAKVFEAIIHWLIQYKEMFGPNVIVKFTCEFDDIRNKVDLVVEFEDAVDGSKHLALAIDVTFGAATSTEKFRQIGEEILADKLTEVKYFESETEKGPLHNIPRVVIGVESDRVRQLATLWMRNDEVELDKHPIGELILNQISIQLKVYREIAEKNDKPKSAEAYANTLGIIQRIRMQQGIRDIGDLAEDKVFKSIENSLYYLKRNLIP